MINLRQDGGRTLVLPHVTLFPSLGGLTVSEEWMGGGVEEGAGSGRIEGRGSCGWYAKQDCSKNTLKNKQEK